MKPVFKRTYKFSTDYEKLFDLLTQGYVIVCYVTWVFSYYDDGEEHILIAPTLSRIDGEDEEIYITKTKDDISIDISINKK